MKMVKKNVVMLVCAALLLQSHGLSSMGTIKKGYEWAKSRATGKLQDIKKSVIQLKDAVKCIDTNSCTPKQQAYIKSLVKKIAVALGAAAVACGIYAVAKSGIGKETIEDIEKKFGVSSPEDSVYLRKIKEFGLAVRVNEQQKINSLHEWLMVEAALRTEQCWNAAVYMIDKGEGGPLTNAKTKELLLHLKHLIFIKPAVKEGRRSGQEARLP